MDSVSQSDFTTVPKLKRPSFRTWLERMDRFFRRLMDICVSVLALILLFPVFLLISVLIKRDSPGPVFYRGDRAARGGGTFKILKFRTMYESAESYRGPKVTGEGDSRITSVGAWLRDTKLNELPQFWNVLKGEMSLVGPRPEDPAITAKWAPEVRKEILSVRPGITSPASVMFRHEESQLNNHSLMDQYFLEVLPSKIRLDQLYVRNHSILTDIDVILWTAMILVPKINKSTIPEDKLIFGPISRFIHRYMTWFLADFFVAFIAVGLAGVLWRLSAPLDLGWSMDVLIALVIALLFSSINALLGLTHITWSKARAEDATDLIISSSLVTGIVFIANLVWPGGRLLPPGMVAVIGAFAFGGFVAIRYRSRLITGALIRWMRLRGLRLSAVGEKILIIGAGEMAQFSIYLIRQGRLAPTFSIAGLIDDDPRKLGTRLHGIKVLGRTHDITRLIEKEDIGLILYAISNIEPVEQERILALCQYSGVPVVMVNDLLETLRAHFVNGNSRNHGTNGDQNPAKDGQPVPSQSRLKTQAAYIRQARSIDKLTGTYNREQLLDLAEMEIPRARRFKRPLTAIVLRIDYARPEGIAYEPALTRVVLHEAGERCKKSIRLVDIIGRCGEKELALVLPETNLSGAQQVAERLYRTLCETPVVSPTGELQISLASVILPLEAEWSAAEEFIEAAINRLPCTEAASA